MLFYTSLALCRPRFRRHVGNFGVWRCPWQERRVPACRHARGGGFLFNKIEDWYWDNIFVEVSTYGPRKTVFFFALFQQQNLIWEISIHTVIESIVVNQGSSNRLPIFAWMRDDFLLLLIVVQAAFFFFSNVQRWSCYLTIFMKRCHYINSTPIKNMQMSVKLTTICFNHITIHTLCGSGRITLIRFWFIRWRSARTNTQTHFHHKTPSARVHDPRIPVKPLPSSFQQPTSQSVFVCEFMRPKARRAVS